MYEFKHPILFVAFIAIFLFHCIQVTSESNGKKAGEKLQCISYFGYNVFMQVDLFTFSCMII